MQAWIGILAAFRVLPAVTGGTWSINVVFAVLPAVTGGIGNINVVYICSITCSNSWYLKY